MITEVMLDPANGVTDGAGEWFEIANRSGHSVAIDLIGLTLRDEAGESHVLDDFTVIYPSATPEGPLLVFGRSRNLGNNGGVVVDHRYTGITFEATDSLTLSRFGGNEVIFDQVAWDAGLTFPNPAGASMSLDPAFDDALSNDMGSSWCDGMSVFGTGQFGTPGQPNDACAFSLTFAFTWTPDDGSAAFGSVTSLDTDGVGRFTTGNAGEGSYALQTTTAGQQLSWTYDNLPNVVYAGMRPFGQAFEWCEGAMVTPGYPTRSGSMRGSL